MFSGGRVANACKYYINSMYCNKRDKREEEKKQQPFDPSLSISVCHEKGKKTDNGIRELENTSNTSIR